MIFVELFWAFLKIGIFTFGGGAAAVALIQNEVVSHQHWLTQQEFTDILAVSQMTPGPVGINTATYAGYTALFNAGYSQWMAVLGAVVASLSVIILPVALMMVVVRFIQRYRSNKYIDAVMRMLRMVVVGIIAAAALQLVTEDSFGHAGWNAHFVISILLFLSVFWLSIKKKNPVVLMLAAGAIGIAVYTLIG